MRKKILYVITKSNWGGAQRYVYDLATNLPKDQFEVSVAFGQPGLLALKLKEAGVTIYPIASLQRDVSVSADFKSFFELFNLFKNEKPDIVHLNSSKAGGVGALAARFAGIKNIVFTAHGWPFWEQRNPISRSLIWLFSWLTALLSHKVIVVSNYDLHVTTHMPFIKNKVVRIYNGIAPMELTDASEIRGYFPGKQVTGTIGELTKNKNQIALIEQARKDPNLYVAIVGDGEDRKFLKDKIDEYGLKQRVVLFGFREARNVLKGFDIFALPSLKEGLPYVLLEAKQAGLPIVANRIGGIPEILDSKDPKEFTLENMLTETTKLYQA
jgi:glycosyltransferase involved in cell wall biosynthesis